MNAQLRNAYPSQCEAGKVVVHTMGLGTNEETASHLFVLSITEAEGLARQIMAATLEARIANSGGAPGGTTISLEEATDQYDNDMCEEVADEDYLAALVSGTYGTHARLDAILDRLGSEA